MLVAKASRIRNNPQLEISINNKQVPNESKLTLLGVEVDNKLNFNEQATKICKKVSKQLGVMSRIKKILPTNTKKTLYRAFILPHFLYCSEVWRHCGKRNQDKLEKLNERALRFVFKDNNSTYDKLLKKMSVPSLVNRRKQDDCIVVYKSMNNSTPKYISELLHERVNLKNLRGVNKLTMPRVISTTYGLNSFRYNAPKLWNSLTDEMRSSCNIKTFITQIRKIDFNE